MAESKNNKTDNKIKKQVNSQQQKEKKKEKQIQQVEGVAKQQKKSQQQTNQIKQTKSEERGQKVVEAENKQLQNQHSTIKQEENNEQSKPNEQTQQNMKPSSRQFLNKQITQTNQKQQKQQEPKRQINSQKKPQSKQDKKQTQQKQSQPNQFFQQPKEQNQKSKQIQQKNNFETVNNVSSPPQQMQQQQQVKQSGILPYNKVSIQFSDFSKYDKSNKGTLTIQQFIELSKDQKYDMTQTRAKQIFQKYNNNEAITYESVNEYTKSMKQFQLIVDLKLDAWKKFNAFRNKCQKFETINDQSTSHHHIALGLKTNENIQTQFRFKLILGNQIKNSHKFNFLLEFQDKNQNYQQVFKQTLEKKSQTLQQLLKYLNISFANGKNRSKIIINNTNNVFINDIINELEEYIKSFGESFHVDIGFQLSAVNNISYLLTDIPLISWLFKGFAFDFQIQGSKQWVKSFRKYLASIIKNHDKKIASYIYLLNNSNINIQFKAPSQASDFFQKLGVNQIINKTSSLKKIFSSSGQQSKINEVIQQLKQLLLPLSSCQQLSLKLTLPFLNLNVETKGNSVKELLSLLI